jgi:ADP-heptose:LPS heptosyltransferase
MKSNMFIHHDGALGDVLLSLPAINVIRKTSSTLHLAAKPEIAIFLKQLGIVQDISGTDSTMYLSLYTAQPNASLKKFLSGFKKAFVFTSRENSIIANSLQTILTHTRVIKTIPPENTNIHVAEFRLRQLKTMIGMTDNEIDNKHPQTSPHIPQVYLEEARELLDNFGYSNESPLISIHIGSGGARKCWKLEYYLELAEILVRDYKAFVIIFTGHVESETTKTEINNFISGKKDMIHISDNELIGVAAFLNISHIYIGNDSGVSHFASLFCRKVIVIFGPTNPILWRPVGKNVEVIRSEQGCAPCSEAMSMDCPDKKCLLEIPISKIIEKIDMLL